MTFKTFILMVKLEKATQPSASSVDGFIVMHRNSWTLQV